jgi:hypothetical protein
MQETVKGVEVSEEVPEDMDSASINDFDAEAQAFPEYMESLEQKGVYLSGPIRCVADNGKGWREDIINDYPEINFNNPLDMYDPDEQEILCDPVDLDSDSDKEQIVPSEYVIEDKTLINQSEAVFLGLPKEIARGSCMESMYSFFQGIPVFVWTMDRQEESGWIFHHSEFIDNDRDEVMYELKKYLGENNE